MEASSYVLAAVMLGFLVSWIPRVFPFILVRYKALPAVLVRFLKHLPLAILFALTLSSLFEGKIGGLPRLNWFETLASLPTFYIAVKSKKLLYAVLTGIVSMALLRLFL